MAQALDIPIGLENIRNEQPAAGPEHAPGLVNGEVAALSALNIVNGHVREDHVEAAVREWKRGDVGGLQSDAIQDPLCDRIPPGGFWRIARLISLAPDVHARDVAARQVPCGQQQHCAAAAAEIENALVSLQGE